MHHTVWLGVEMPKNGLLTEYSHLPKTVVQKIFKTSFWTLGGAVCRVLSSFLDLNLWNQSAPNDLIGLKWSPGVWRHLAEKVMGPDHLLLLCQLALWHAKFLGTDDQFSAWNSLIHGPGLIDDMKLKLPL